MNVIQMLADVPEYLAHHGLNANTLDVLEQHGRLDKNHIKPSFVEGDLREPDVDEVSN